MLTIVSKHDVFLKSARVVFAGHPAVRIVTSYDSVDPSGRTAYILPSDSYGIVYSPYLFPDANCQAHIDSLWKQPLLPDTPLWYSVDSVLYIVAPCLRVGLTPYCDETCAPYIALRSVLFLASSQHIDTFICPALGVDPGGFDPELASMQMCQAWNDYIIYTAGTAPLQPADPIREQK